ncbi:enoyl-CoA hydratase [Frankia gtarii]|uniref:enoyl-CoA hydratase n=1 Tax=Frankia gtarii TaxID=2950102 RepID=UPI0021C1B551|nr:enoyl-CoA hydratase [Frankia gtarii]
MSDVLIAETLGTTRLITMNRPQARNALGGGLITELYSALVAADENPDVHVVVLTGADPAFCAGVDLKEAARDGKKYFDQFADTNCVGQVARMRTPIIGAVNGAAFTGGLELALGCDFLIASERAVFADTHVRVGVLPGGGMTAHLPLFVGIGNARRMSLSGAIVDAAEALRMGLVTEVVPHGELRERALAVAANVGEVDPRMTRGLKKVYAEGIATYTAPASAAETRGTAETPPAFAEIEQRRVEVMAGNRARLGADRD